jgi:sulfite exporter TauE/SafE
VAGALAGALTAGIPSKTIPVSQFTQWFLAAALLMLALGLEKRIPQPLWLSRLLFRIRLRSALGWVTPLLPCGPLWLILGAAFVSAHWLSGALLGGAFAAGTIPLFLLLQHGWGRSLQNASPRLLPRLQQTLLVVSASLLLWRSLTPHGCCH